MPSAVAPVCMISVVPVMTVAVSLTRSRLYPAPAAVSAAGPGGGARIGGAGGRGGSTGARGARGAKSRARAVSGGVRVGGGRGSGACGPGPFACVPAQQSLYRS